MFFKFQEVGVIDGFKVESSTLGIPILQFADNTLVMVDEAKAMRDIHMFEAFSGLKISVSNNVLYEVNGVADCDVIFHL